MASDGGTAQRRLLEYVAAAVAFVVVGVVVGVVAIVVLQDDPSDVPEGSDAAIALEEVETESITAQMSYMTTIARHDDQVLIVDGVATDGERKPWEAGAEPGTRVWVVDADDPETAHPFDLPSVGPRLFPEVWWWDGRWALMGMRCPQPWDQDQERADYEEEGEDTLPETCGEDVSDVYLFDPDAESLRTVATGMEGRVRWTSTNGDRAMLNNFREGVEGLDPREDLWTLALDGTRTDIDDIPGRRYSVVPAGVEFIALQVENRGDFRDGELQDTADFWRLHRLAGTEWLPEDLPPTGVEQRTNDGGFAGGDFVLTVGRGGLPSPDPRATEMVLFTADPTTGDVDWEPLPLDGLPDPPDLMPQPKVVDGEVVYLDGDLARRWDGGTWVDTVWWGLWPEAYVEDFTRLLHFDSQEDWGSLTITIDAPRE